MLYFAPGALPHQSSYYKANQCDSVIVVAQLEGLRENGPDDNDDPIEKMVLWVRTDLDRRRICGHMVRDCRGI
jgi:hypothetical protein